MPEFVYIKRHNSVHKLMYMLWVVAGPQINIGNRPNGCTEEGNDKTTMGHHPSLSLYACTTACQLIMMQHCIGTPSIAQS